jgi:hypothetical protein
LFLGNVPRNATLSVIQNIYAKIKECYIYKAKKLNKRGQATFLKKHEECKKK